MFVTDVTAQQGAESATQQKNADRAATVSLVRALAQCLESRRDVLEKPLARYRAALETLPTGQPE